MIARLDHRPMLTAALALSTTVLLVVVVTLSTLLMTLPQAANPPSLRDSGNHAGPTPKVMDAESYGEVYGWDIQPKDQRPGVHDQAGERHHKIVGDYLSADSPLRDK
jgi:hypothetical protein